MISPMIRDDRVFKPGQGMEVVVMTRITGRRRRLLVSGGLTVAFLLITGLLVLTKVIRITPLFAGRYPVHGVDVSHYQGEIDWEVLSGQDIRFAYIKATEGSRYVDQQFSRNWDQAGQTELLTGAYHFFSFDSSAQTQAELYIRTVGDLSGKLAPVVDVEYYGDKRAHPPDKDAVVAELTGLLQLLEAHYQIRPVIYTTYPFYDRYIAGSFDDYPLWIRNVYYPPDLDGKHPWVFWQYTDTAVMDGYQGDERYIDMDVFCGTEEELGTFLVP